MSVEVAQVHASRTRGPFGRRDRPRHTSAECRCQGGVYVFAPAGDLLHREIAPLKFEANSGAPSRLDPSFPAGRMRVRAFFPRPPGGRALEPLNANLQRSALTRAALEQRNEG